MDDNEMDIEPNDSKTINESHIVDKLKLYKAPEQRSNEWFAMRKNMMTASDLSAALKMTDMELTRAKNGIFEIKDKQKKIGSSCNPYSSFNEYIRKKCGVSKKFTGNAATQWGQMLEPLATQLYEKYENNTVIEFGLLPHHSMDWLGASPDGITPDGRMLEIKCPMSREITGTPTIYYLSLIHI